MHLADAGATEGLGGLIAAATNALPGGWLVTLEGGLGAGKTTLARGFLRALGYAGRVPSPTYTLVEPYEVQGRRILHVDLYRLSDPAELDYLGFRDSLDRNVTALVEWPDRAGGVLASPDVRVSLTIAGDGRDAQVAAGSPRGRKLVEYLREVAPDGPSPD
jgi:tRNA threonylcarbamoyladenosine biosynthesis protein TsaE